MSTPAVSILVPRSVPAIKAGDDLAAVILDAMDREGIELRPLDIVVVAQKIVSKAEGRLVDLTEVFPSDRARELAARTGKDPRLMEVMLAETKEVLRAVPNICVIEHRLGHVMANGGIDQSNVSAPGEEREVALLLPEDPDRSAAGLRQRFEARGASPVGVVISDSFGRPWRIGSVGVAIGLAGPKAVIDRRGDRDLFGRTLQVTEIGFADAVAAAAVLVMGEADEGAPVAILRGLDWTESTQGAADILRPREKDLFR